jgi:hypothetical protein
MYVQDVMRDMRNSIAREKDSAYIIIISALILYHTVPLPAVAGYILGSLTMSLFWVTGLIGVIVTVLNKYYSFSHQTIIDFFYNLETNRREEKKKEEDKKEVKLKQEGKVWQVKFSEKDEAYLAERRKVEKLAREKDGQQKKVEGTACGEDPTEPLKGTACGEDQKEETPKDIKDDKDIEDLLQLHVMELHHHNRLGALKSLIAKIEG